MKTKTIGIRWNVSLLEEIYSICEREKITFADSVRSAAIEKLRKQENDKKIDEIKNEILMEMEQKFMESNEKLKRGIGYLSGRISELIKTLASESSE